MYRITELNMKGADHKFKRYNDKMKIYLANNVNTSPELKMLTERGATFKVVSGCWGGRSDQVWIRRRYTEKDRVRGILLCEVERDMR